MDALVIPKLNTASLIARAFDDHQSHGGKKDLATATDHDVNHITLNYIRHKLIPNYHNIWFDDPWKYFSWFARINRIIADAYPFLKVTVEQQIQRKELRLSTEKYITKDWEEIL